MKRLAAGVHGASEVFESPGRRRRVAVSKGLSGPVARVLGLFASAFVIGCAGDAPSEDASTSARTVCHSEYSEQIYDGSGRATSLAVLADAASRRDYVLIGEVHDNPTHHANQLALLRSLSERGGVDHLLFEMAHPGFGPVLDQYNRSGATSDELRQALLWDERGWPLWDSYYPLFEEARRQGATVHGANVSDDPFLGDRELLTRLVAGVHGVAEADAAPFAVAQYAKDAHMARAMVQTDGRAVLIAGNYHVLSTIGVPVHLERLTSRASSTTVGMIELSDTVPSPRAYFRHTPASLRDYDFVWFTETRCRSDRPTE